MLLLLLGHFRLILLWKCSGWLDTLCILMRTIESIIYKLLLMSTYIHKSLWENGGKWALLFIFQSPFTMFTHTHNNEKYGSYHNIFIEIIDMFEIKVLCKFFGVLCERSIERTNGYELYGCASVCSIENEKTSSILNRKRIDSF